LEHKESKTLTNDLTV